MKLNYEQADNLAWRLAEAVAALWLDRAQRDLSSARKEAQYLLDHVEERPIFLDSSYLKEKRKLKGLLLGLPSFLRAVQRHQEAAQKWDNLPESPLKNVKAEALWAKERLY